MTLPRSATSVGAPLFLKRLTTHGWDFTAVAKLYKVHGNTIRRHAKLLYPEQLAAARASGLAKCAGRKPILAGTDAERAENVRAAIVASGGKVAPAARSLGLTHFVFVRWCRIYAIPYTVVRNGVVEEFLPGRADRLAPPADG